MKPFFIFSIYLSNFHFGRWKFPIPIDDGEKGEGGRKNSEKTICSLYSDNNEFYKYLYVSYLNSEYINIFRRKKLTN
ncbi:MAG: hypothetical protein C6I01_04935 [Epsilonproteobacteria bacterium]|nr:hypothetical protein [Campylobacterota bacterium]